MSNLIHNEKIKLWGTYYNNMSVAVIVAGAITPLFSADPYIVQNKWIFWAMATVVSVICRFMADWNLNKLKG